MNYIFLEKNGFVLSAGDRANHTERYGKEEIGYGYYLWISEKIGIGYKWGSK